jgi:hypothetical protein
VLEERHKLATHALDVKRLGQRLESLDNKQNAWHFRYSHIGMTIVDPTNPWNSKNYGLFMQSEVWIRGRKKENNV